MKRVKLCRYIGLQQDSGEYKIQKIHAREILDSREIPNYWSWCIHTEGIWPEPVSPQELPLVTNEALELRDADPNRYEEKGVLTAVKECWTLSSRKNCLGSMCEISETIDEWWSNWTKPITNQVWEQNSILVYLWLRKSSLQTSLEYLFPLL